MPKTRTRSRSRRHVSEENNLDMKIRNQLYQAHKSLSDAGHHDLANEVLDRLQKPTEEEDNLDMKTEEEEDEDDVEADKLKLDEEDGDEDGKPSTNDPEPDDLKKKTARASEGLQFSRRLFRDEPARRKKGSRRTLSLTEQRATLRLERDMARLQEQIDYVNDYPKLTARQFAAALTA